MGNFLHHAISLCVLKNLFIAEIHEIMNINYFKVSTKFVA